MVVLSGAPRMLLNSEVDVDFTAKMLREERILQLQEEEARLEAAGQHIAAMALRKGRFDILMGLGYKPPSIINKAFRGKKIRQVNVVMYATVLRHYRRAFHFFGLPVPGVPKLRTMGFRPFRQAA